MLKLSLLFKFKTQCKKKKKVKSHARDCGTTDMMST